MDSSNGDGCVDRGDDSDGRVCGEPVTVKRVKMMTGIVAKVAVVMLLVVVARYWYWSWHYCW